MLAHEYLQSDDWADAPEIKSAPQPQTQSADWLDVNDWGDVPAPVAAAPEKPRDLLAEQRAAGTVDSDGRVLPERLGVIDTAGAIGRQVVDAAAYHLPGAVAAALEGSDPYSERDLKDTLIERSRKRASEGASPRDKYQNTAIPGVSSEDIRQLGPSLGFSAVGAGAGFGAGIPAAAAGNLVAPVAGTVAGFAAGGAASGVAAYRMSTNQFVRDLRDAADQESTRVRGRPMTDTEFSAQSAHLEPLIREYGLWEAVPEAAGNVIGFGILSSGAKSAIGRAFGKNILTRISGKAASLYGEELATETVTQQGQHNVEVNAGLGQGPERSWTSPTDIGQSFKEVAPVTVLQTTLMGAGVKGGMMLKDRLGRQAGAQQPQDVPAAGPAGPTIIDAEFTPVDAEQPALPAPSIPGDTIPVSQPQQPGPPPGAGPGASTASLSNLMADPRPAAEIVSAENEQRKAQVDAARNHAFSAFGLEPGGRALMSMGSSQPEPVTVADAWMDGDKPMVRVVGDSSGDWVTALGDVSFSPLDGDGTRVAPIKATAPEHVDVAAQQADTAPTDAQKQAGNYQKGHLKLHGLDITIENARGSARSGTDPNGQSWSVDMPAHYGYVKRTTGADGDHVDVYIGPSPESDTAVVIDQLDLRTGKFDEHKVMLGVSDPFEALDLYESGFSDGKGAQRVGAFTVMSIDEFKSWLKDGDTKNPVAWRRPSASQGTNQVDDSQIEQVWGPDDFTPVPDAPVVESAEQRRQNHPANMAALNRDSDQVATSADAVSREQVERLAGEAAFALRRQPQPPSLGTVKGEELVLMDDIGTFKRWFVHPRMIAALHKAFVPVYRTAEKQFQTRDEIAAELTRQMAPYTKLTGEQKGKVNAALELSRLRRLSAPNTGGNISIRNSDQPEAQLSGLGEVVNLTADETAAYRAVRATMDTALDLFKAQVIREWGLDPAAVSVANDIDALASKQTDQREIDRLHNLAMAVREIEQAKRQGYVPFKRWGQVGIVAKSKGNGTTLFFKMVEVDGLIRHGKRWVNKVLGRPVNFGSIPEVKAALDAAKAKYAGRNDVEVAVIPVYPNQPMAGEVHMADLDMLAQVANIDEKTWDSVKQRLQTAMQAREFRSHFFGSRNTPGYSADLERSLADYVVGISGYLARRRFAEVFEKAIGAIPRGMPKLREYSQNYVTYIQNPSEELQTLRQIGFVYYLAGSPATAFVNMTQVPVITAPYLTQFHGAAGVSRELARAYKDTALMLTRKQGMDLFDPDKAPADVAQALRQAWDEGFFVPLNTFEMMGLAHNRNQTLRRLSKKARTAVDILSLMFTMAERENRLVTFIAAYRLAKSPGFEAKAAKVLKENALARSEDLLRDWSPEKFAAWAIDETHYRMGKVNRPVVMRHAGAALLQFKGFAMQTIELFWRLGVQNGREGKVAGLLIMAAMLAFSGGWGMPFAEDITDLIEAIAKKIHGADVDVRTEFRQIVAELTGSPKLAEVMAHGAPRAAGVDLTRIGMGNLLPGTYEEAGGIPFSLTLGRLEQSMAFASHGDTSLAVAELLPTFAKNAIHAWYWGSDGGGVRSQKTGAMVIPPEEVTVAQQMMKAIGFTPAAIANRRQMDFAKNRSDKAVSEKKSGFYAEMARLVTQVEKYESAGNKAGADKALREIDAVYEEIGRFNEGRPDHEVVVLNRQQLRSKIRAEMIGDRSKDKTAPKSSRTRRQELGAIYGE